MKHTLQRLDLMIAYSCNISCLGCISLSDHKRNGVAALTDITQWINEWSYVVDPAVLTIFGGEPLLHPHLLEICQLVRNAWPDTIIRLITNGYLLENFDVEKWFTLGKFEMQVSVHRKDHEYIINKNLKNIMLCKKGWKTINHGGNQHKQIEWRNETVSIYKSIFKDFVVPYKQINGDILPWNSDPVSAHSMCGSPDTPILYKGQLYKCPPVANIIDLTGVNYKNYQGFKSTDNLIEFINNINCPELVCGQCPDQKNAVIIDHFDTKNVIIKQKNIS
jgi:hypothetical protein